MLQIGSREPRAELAQSYGQVLKRIARVDVLVIDDWGLAPLDERERRDLYEILDDRYGVRSTIIASQLSPANWHDHVGDPMVADWPLLET